MDVFCMTSLYEGLPMVGLEAQASRKNSYYRVRFLQTRN
ncbi:hypothetical protein SNF32_06670 [Enterococcus mundtii]|nr:hypothetical protein [Enterococcus mundtii]